MKKNQKKNKKKWNIMTMKIIQMKTWKKIN